MYIVKISKKGSKRKKDVKSIQYIGEFSEEVRKQWVRIAALDKQNDYEFQVFGGKRNG